MLKNSFLGFFLLIAPFIYAQIDLESILSQQADSAHVKAEAVRGTFKGTKLINGHSIEAPGPGVLQFIIYHRFSNMNDVLYDFFGLDGATTRIGLDYGINKRLTVGLGRTAVLKATDVYGKYKLLIQNTETMPVSLSLVLGSSYNTIRAPYYKSDRVRRLNYLSQALIARKFSGSFSAQLMPTLVYNNLAETSEDKNAIFAQGYGARLKITRRTSINWEHYVVLPGQVNKSVRNTIALGFDIDTGGHIFQFHLTNAGSMIEQQFIPLTTGNITKGEFRLGFNISRVFTIDHNAASR